MDKTEITPDVPTQKSEEQLSITFDDIARTPRIMTAEEYLQTKEKLAKADHGAPGESKRLEEENAPAKSAESGVRVSEDNAAPQAAKLPQNPIAPKAPKPAPQLSDMEVMEHTASIWQYKEIVDDKTEAHSEYHEKRTVTPTAEIIGARVRGKKHKHEGTNCDDFFETAVTDDCIITVVCDGAGSKPLSRIGSRVSAESAAAFLKEKLSELFKNKPGIKSGIAADLKSAEFMAACGRIAPLVQEAAREAFAAQRDILGELSENENYEKALGRKPVLSDLSTTFLAAVTVPLTVAGKPQTFMACVQIGDGCICAIDGKAASDSCLKLLGEADSGAFSGETDFLSEKNSRAEAIGGKTRISRGSSDTILLMSDGVADDYFPAAPMMQRLYLDLCLNGIIPMSTASADKKLGGEDPAPIRFKSVSASQQSVALQYAKQLLPADKSEEAINGLWDKRDMLWCHSLEAFRMNIGDTPEERLRVWLDNYNERGSFDDRTLVVVRLTRSAE